MLVFVCLGMRVFCVVVMQWVVAEWCCCDAMEVVEDGQSWALMVVVKGFL